jgi:hypothetical protein
VPPDALPAEFALTDASLDTPLALALTVFAFALAWRALSRAPRVEPSLLLREMFLPVVWLLAAVSLVVLPDLALARVRVDPSGTWTLRSGRGDVLYEGPLLPGCSLTTTEQSARLDLFRRRLVRARLRVADGLDWPTAMLDPDDPVLSRLRELVDARCAIAPDAAPVGEPPRPE